MSGVMTRDGEPDVTWYVFDRWDIDKPYMHRARAAKESIQEAGLENIVWLPQTLIRTVEELYAYEDARVQEGYEGVILRAPSGPYKQNRSTLKEGLMLKVKRFLDSEAEIVGAYELMHNNNEATTDVRGYTKRSTHAANKEAAGILGGFNVRDIYSGVEFDLGTGYTFEQRKNLWEAWLKNPNYLKGKLCKYKHFPVGVVDKPRHPIFLGFRDRRDV
jgi:DNA ligase-1